jgi:hypothetical protein
VPEVRRVILAMTKPKEEQESRLGWSLWRRAHQAVAKRCYTARTDRCEAQVRGAAAPSCGKWVRQT